MADAGSPVSHDSPTSEGGLAVPGSSSSSSSGGEEDRDIVVHGGLSLPMNEQDLYLPIANITRIMKRALPANAKITRDAKDIVQECVTEFIGFITSEASDKCHREKRKTINGDDIIWAMTTLGFENYVPPLKTYLQRFRELEVDPKVAGGSKSGPEASAKQAAMCPLSKSKVLL